MSRIAAFSFSFSFLLAVACSSTQRPAHSAAAARAQSPATIRLQKRVADSERFHFELAGVSNGTGMLVRGERSVADATHLRNFVMAQVDGRGEMRWLSAPEGANARLAFLTTELGSSKFTFVSFDDRIYPARAVAIGEEWETRIPREEGLFSADVRVRSSLQAVEGSGDDRVAVIRSQAEGSNPHMRIRLDSVKRVRLSDGYSGTEAHEASVFGPTDGSDPSALLRMFGDVTVSRTPFASRPAERFAQLGLLVRRETALSIPREPPSPAAPSP